MYDTSVMIKEDKNSVLVFNQDLAGSSRDVEGSRGKIMQAKFHTEFAGTSQVCRGMSQDIEGKSLRHAICHRAREIFAGRG